MNGISFGRCMLRITRPTVVSISARSHRLDLGVDDVLVVVLRLEVDVLARCSGPGSACASRPRPRRRASSTESKSGKTLPSPFAPCLAMRQVVAAEDEVLRRHRERPAVRRRQDVVRREHQDLALDLRLGRQRHVHGHLVAVEVGVERRADQRMDLDRLALDQHRLERLDAEAVQRRRAVQQHRMVADDLLERVPDLVLLALDHLLGRLDRADAGPSPRAGCR